MNDCYERASGSGAYALGALSAEEAAEFEAALAESPELRAETEGFSATAALLAQAVPPVAPSAALKASIFAAIDAQTREEQVADPSAVEPAGTHGGESAAPHEEESAEQDRLATGQHMAPRMSRPRARARALRALVSSAAAVVLFIGGALAGGILSSISAERTSDRFAALNAAPDLIRTTTPLPEGGSIAFVASEELGMSAVVLHDAELPEGRTFQAWHVAESGPKSAGVVEPDDGGTVYRMLDGRWEGGTVAMTIEPEGGSPEPTTEPMVLTEGTQAS